MILMGLLMFFNSQAQQNKWKPWVIPELGYLSGTYEVTGDLRLQGGIQKNGWNFGLGTGVDYYHFTSFPIYAQARKMIGKKKGKPFLLTSLGISIPSVETSSKTDFRTMSLFSSFRPVSPEPYYYDMGFYGEIGAGYAFLNKKGRGLLLSLSFTQKRIEETHVNNNFAIQGMGAPNDEVNVYIMNRAAVRIGYKF